MIPSEHQFEWVRSSIFYRYIPYPYYQYEQILMRWKKGKWNQSRKGTSLMSFIFSVAFISNVTLKELPKMKKNRADKKCRC